MLALCVCQRVYQSYYLLTYILDRRCSGGEFVDKWSGSQVTPWFRVGSATGFQSIRVVHTFSPVNRCEEMFRSEDTLCICHPLRNWGSVKRDEHPVFGGVVLLHLFLLYNCSARAPSGPLGCVSSIKYVYKNKNKYFTPHFFRCAVIQVRVVF